MAYWCDDRKLADEQRRLDERQQEAERALLRRDKREAWAA